MTKLDVMVSAAELADWLGIGVLAVSGYGRAGVTVRAPERGKYFLQKSVQGYVSHMRSAAAGRTDDETAQQRARLLSAQADSAEARARKLSNAYLGRAEVAATWASMKRSILAVLGEIPAEVSSRLPHLTAHDIAELASEIELAMAPLKDEAKGE